MTAEPLFESSMIKVRRANSHLAELRKLLADYFAGDWYRTSLTERPGAGPEFRVGIKHVPTEFGAIVGDVVHNLRAALDLLAVRAVELNGENTKDVYFPFSRSEEEFEGMLKKRHLDKASASDQARIRALAPYKGGNVILRALHDLDIEDKHIALIPHAAGITTPQLSIKHDASGNPILDQRGQLRVEFDPNEKPQVRFVFPDESALAGQEIVIALEQMYALVEATVKEFEAVPR